MLNNLYLGSVKPSKYYIGSSEVQKMYLGSTLVYQREDVWVFEKGAGEPDLYKLPARGGRPIIPNIVSTRNGIPHRYDFTSTSNSYVHSTVSHSVPPGSGDDNVTSLASIFADDLAVDAQNGRVATLTYTQATSGNTLVIPIYQHTVGEYILESSSGSVIINASGVGATVTITSTVGTGSLKKNVDFTYEAPSWIQVEKVELGDTIRLMIKASANEGVGRNGTVIITQPDSEKQIFIIVRLDANSDLEPYLEPTLIEVGASDTSSFTVNFYPNETAPTITNNYGWVTTMTGWGIDGGTFLTVKCSANLTLLNRVAHIGVRLSNGDAYTVTVLLYAYELDSGSSGGVIIDKS